MTVLGIKVCKEPAAASTITFFFHCLRCIVRIESGTKALFCDVISVRIESGTKALICGVNNDVVFIATTCTSLADTR